MGRKFHQNILGLIVRIAQCTMDQSINLMRLYISCNVYFYIYTSEAFLKKTVYLTSMT